MDDARIIYTNVQAEGARVGQENVLDEHNARMALRTWKRGGTILHMKMIALERGIVKEARRRYYVADLGVAEALLPIEETYSGIHPYASNVRQLEERLLQHWVAVVQGLSRGGHRVNVGGFDVLIPRAYYDWDRAIQPKIGDEFAVVRRRTLGDTIVVSRRDTMPNPFRSSMSLAVGSLVYGQISRIQHGRVDRVRSA